MYVDSSSTTYPIIASSPAQRVGPRIAKDHIIARATDNSFGNCIRIVPIYLRNAS